MKPRKPINKISRKRLARDFNNRVPYSTIGRSSKGLRIPDFESGNLGSNPSLPAKSIPKVSVKQRAKQQKLNEIRHRWWIERERVCGICSLGITAFEDYVLDHIKPRGMGGGTRDDSEANLQPTHWRCNALKGSRRL